MPSRTRSSTAHTKGIKRSIGEANNEPDDHPFEADTKPDDKAMEADGHRATSIAADFDLPPSTSAFTLDLIDSSDLPFEAAVAHHTGHLRPWLDYIDHKCSSTHPLNVIIRNAPADSQDFRHAYDLALRSKSFIFERAIRDCPGYYLLYKRYLQIRVDALIGIPMDARGRVGGIPWTSDWQAWKEVFALFERSIAWLATMPRLWLDYISLLARTPHLTLIRRTFDRAIRTLPQSLHERIWSHYINWIEGKLEGQFGVDLEGDGRNGDGASSSAGEDDEDDEGLDDVQDVLHHSLIPSETILRIARRYLSFNQLFVEDYISILLDSDPPRPLLAARQVADLILQAGPWAGFKSPSGKAPHQYMIWFLKIIQKYHQGVPLPEDKDTAVLDNEDGAGLDVNRVIRFCLDKFPDQQGRLLSALATYHIYRGDFDLATAAFEEGITTANTVRDFTQVFDAYSEFEESTINAAMEEAQERGEPDEEADLALDQSMKHFEELMDRRPFLVNDVLLRRNPNDVNEWEKRIALWGDDQEKVVETYLRALKVVNPLKAPRYYSLYISFAKLYEEGGELASARRIFEEAVKQNYKTVGELAELWCEWAEMEVRNGHYDKALEAMRRATNIPKKKNVHYHDDSIPIHARLFKSIKLWSFYVDLEESIGTVDDTRRVYDKMLDLKIATPQVIINYAEFLEEHKYYEDSFKVFERAVEAFSYPTVFEIWNIYLSKFVARYGGSRVERTRDLFEQALEHAPPEFAKTLFLAYGKFEEEHGLPRHAMRIYDRATRAVSDKDRFEMFSYQVAKVTMNHGLTAAREVYQRAIEVLPNLQAKDMSLRYAALERKLGEIDRARAIYAHASQFCNPRTMPEFWKEWNDFEIACGSEDTFREMLRIKRSVQTSFNTDAEFLANQTISSSNPNGASVSSSQPQVPGDAMEQVAARKNIQFVQSKSKVEEAGAEASQNPEEIEIENDDDYDDDEGDE